MLTYIIFFDILMVYVVLHTYLYFIILYMEDFEMKFCGNCGSQMDDNASVCPKCGTSQGAAGQSAAAPSAAKSANNLVNNVKSMPKAAQIGICAGVAVVVVLLIALIIDAVVGYKKPIKKHFKLEMSTTKAANKLYLPAESSKENTKYKLTFKDSEKISKTNLKKLQEAYNEEKNVDYKFSSGKLVKVHVKKYGGDETKEYDMCFVMVKKGLKWYIFDYDVMGKGEKLKDVLDSVIPKSSSKD